MSRYAFTLDNPRLRAEALRVVGAAPVGYRVEIKEPKRTIDQNSRLWPLLTCFSLAKPVINGIRRVHTPDQWKVILLSAWGREVQFLPGLDGSSVVPYGQSSSDLSVSEMVSFQDFIEATAAELDIDIQRQEAGGVSSSARAA